MAEKRQFRLSCAEGFFLFLFFLFFKQASQLHNIFCKVIFEKEKKNNNYSDVALLSAASRVAERFCSQTRQTRGDGFVPNCVRRPDRTEFSLVFFEPYITMRKYGLGSLERLLPPRRALLSRAYISRVDNRLS